MTFRYREDWEVDCDMSNSSLHFDFQEELKKFQTKDIKEALCELGQAPEGNSV